MTKRGGRALASGPEGKHSWGDRIRKGLQGIKEGVDELGEALGGVLAPPPQPIPIPVKAGNRRPTRGPGGF